MEKRHRIFIAINLPGEIKSELFSYSEKWPELPCKWTAKDNLHITLEFLGDLTDQEIGDACQAVKNVAEKNSCFSLNISQVVYGPYSRTGESATGSSSPLAKNRAPKFVWAVGEKSKELTDLKQDLEESLLQKVAFIPEGRGFAPHITLARISAWAWKGIEPEERPEINEKLELVFTVESIEVMESVLKRDGPQYTILESHSLS